MSEDETTLQSRRTTVRRLPARASYDRRTIERVLDEALFCHVGFVSDAQPYVLPTIHARIGERLYLHGSVASRMLGSLREGVPVAVCVTLLDGLVLARSAFHHSMNYRSVVILGTAFEVTDPEEKRRALEAIVEHVVAGRSAEVRGPSPAELRATLVLSIPILEASAKIRTGPPRDEPEDMLLPCWAGEIPIGLEPRQPVPDPALPAGVPVPAYVTSYRRP